MSWTDPRKFAEKRDDQAKRSRVLWPGTGIDTANCGVSTVIGRRLDA